MCAERAAELAAGGVCEGLLSADFTSEEAKGEAEGAGTTASDLMSTPP